MSSTFKKLKLAESHLSANYKEDFDHCTKPGVLEIHVGRVSARS